MGTGRLGAQKVSHRAFRCPLEEICEIFSSCQNTQSQTGSEGNLLAARFAQEQCRSWFKRS